jgi:hypothetical protein
VGRQASTALCSARNASASAHSLHRFDNLAVRDKLHLPRLTALSRAECGVVPRRGQQRGVFGRLGSRLDIQARTITLRSTDDRTIGSPA